MVLETGQVRAVGNDRQPQVESAIGHRRLDALAIHIDQVDLHLRVTALEARQQRRQEVAEHCIRGADTHLALHYMAEEQWFTQGVLQSVEDVPGVLGELVPLGGQRHAIGQALEQADAQALFQLQDRRGNRRLRNMHLERGLGELASIRRRHEVTELTHGNIFAFRHLLF
ncbi:hypothetical protein D9M69_180250 [compost metagenome]